MEPMRAGGRPACQAGSEVRNRDVRSAAPEAGSPRSDTAAQQHSRAEAVEAAGGHADAPPEALAQLVARVRGAQLAQGLGSASARRAPAAGPSRAPAAGARAPRDGATAGAAPRGVLPRRAAHKRAAWVARRGMLEVVRPSMDALGLRRRGAGAPVPPHVSQGRLKLKRWILGHLLDGALPRRCLRAQQRHQNYCCAAASKSALQAVLHTWSAQSADAGHCCRLALQSI